MEKNKKSNMLRKLRTLAGMPTVWLWLAAILYVYFYLVIKFRHVVTDEDADAEKDLFPNDDNNLTSKLTAAVTESEEFKRQQTLHIFLEKKLDMNRVRKEKVMDACTELGDRISPPEGAREMRSKGDRMFVLSDARKLAYCATEYSGFNLWNKTLAMLDSNVVNQVYWRQRDFDLETLLKKYPIRFLVSRHPYTRVVAFYHHSLLKSNKRSLNWPKMLQDAGIKEMHIRDDKLLSEKGLPSFTNFIRYLNNNNGVVRLENPITEHIDKQFQPIHLSCDVCQLDYNVIAKFETLRDDWHYILALAEVSEMPPIKKGEIMSAGIDINTHMIREKMRELDHKTLKEFVNLFKFDFEAFGYSESTFL